MSHSQPRILLVKLSSLGDVLHTLPTLEALRGLYPRGHLIWLVEAAYAPLVRQHPALDEVWEAPRLHWEQLRQPQTRTALFQLVRRLRARPFDLVIDLQGLLKSAWWVALARSGRKVGFDRTRELSYLALTEKLPPYDRDEHAVLRYLRVARHLGAPPALPRFRLPLAHWQNSSPQIPPSPPFPKGGAISNSSPLQRVGAIYDSRRPLAVLHPGTRWPSKHWPAASWAQLADWLHREYGLQVFLSGSATDRALADRIIGAMREPVVDLVGRTSLPELALIMKQAVLAVTTDTGPMHLAAAVGTRIVALFGPTAPWRTGPFGPGHEILRLGLECSPCFKRQCPQPRCLADLPLELVQKACEKLLSAAEITC